jgi:hypothetical protein
MGGLVQKLGGWTQYPQGYTINIGSTVRALWAWEDTNSNSYLGVGADGVSPGIVTGVSSFSVTITGASGDGTTATLTYSGSYAFPVGGNITVSGMTPSGYNGNYIVTASTAGTVSYLNSTTGFTSGGTIGPIVTLTFTGEASFFANKSITVSGTTTYSYATTAASGTGSVATLTFPGSYVYPVGTSIIVTGVTPTGYNGVYTVTVSSAGSVSYANATTGSQTVAGVISTVSPYNGTFTVTSATPTTVSYIPTSAVLPYYSGGLIYGGGQSLSVILNGSNPDITPEKLTANAAVNFSTTANSNEVVVTEAGRDTNNFWTVDIQTQVSVGGLVLFGQYQVYNPGLIPNQYKIKATNVLGAPQNATYTTTAPITITGLTASSPSAGYVTLTFSGAYVFPVGSTFIVSGVTPAGYNGTYVVTNSAAGSVSYANATTGAMTVAGTVFNNGVVPRFTTSSGASLVTVTLPNHGYAEGETFPVLVATSVGGILIKNNLIVSSVTDTNTFIINAPTSASSSATEYENLGLVRFVYYNGVGPLPAKLGYGKEGYGYYGYGGIVPATDRGVPINATDWTLDNWGETFIASPIGGPVFAWNPTSGAPVAICIANAPTVNQGVFVAMPQRQIIACGSTFNGVSDPLLVRWCDVDNYDSWIGTLVNQAGYYRIPKGSRIIQGIQAGQQALLWTDLGIWAMQYVGPPYVYQFNELGTGCGLIGRKAAGSMNGVVYWMGQSQFYRLAGSGVEPIRCPVWDVVFQDLDTDNLDKIRVAPNSRFGEIAWHYPMVGNLGITNIVGNGSSVTVTYSGVGTFSVGSTVTLSAVTPATYNGSYVVISTSGNTATFVSTETASYVSGGLISGSLENNGFVKYNIVLDQWDYSFNNSSNAYVARTAWTNESVLGPPIGAASNNFLYQHETSPDAAGSAMNSYFQTGYFVLSEADVKMFIDQVWPDMKWGYFGGAQSANILLTFYVADYAGQQPLIYGPYTLTQATTYVTPRFRGRLVSIRIQSTDAGSWWRLGNFRYRLQPDGRF